jgi:hypothetical protein
VFLGSGHRGRFHPGDRSLYVRSGRRCPIRQTCSAIDDDASALWFQGQPAPEARQESRREVLYFDKAFVRALLFDFALLWGVLTRAALHCIKRIHPALYLCKAFDFGSHREVGRMFLIHEPEQALHGAQRSDFLLRFGSRHYQCIHATWSSPKFNLNFVSIQRILLTFRRDCWAGQSS